MTFCANPVGTQAIHACNCTFNDHLRVDEIVNKLFALYDPDLVTRRCQDHPPPAAAKHSRHAYSGGTHNDPPARKRQSRSTSRTRADGLPLYGIVPPMKQGGISSVWHAERWLLCSATIWVRGWRQSG